MDTYIILGSVMVLLFWLNQTKSETGTSEQNLETSKVKKRRKLYGRKKLERFCENAFFLLDVKDGTFYNEDGSLCEELGNVRAYLNNNFIDVRDVSGKIRVRILYLFYLRREKTGALCEVCEDLMVFDVVGEDKGGLVLMNDNLCLVFVGSRTCTNDRNRRIEILGDKARLRLAIEIVEYEEYKLNTIYCLPV